ncbi:MAG: hypothetical protein ACD_20C00293G0004 [uncultured bacterium]|nr:MAG: hypothetical protein ACD_20C00293G0004 [uncultured bacterium]
MDAQEILVTALGILAIGFIIWYFFFVPKK